MPGYALTMKPLFFQRRSDAESESGELRRMVSRLKACQSQMRCSVGAGVSVANENFIRRFAGIERFRSSSLSEQERFWSDLSELEFGLRSEAAGMAMGVSLYRIWLAGTLAGKHELAELLGEELSELTRKG